jgi:hypothetical protein
MQNIFCVVVTGNRSSLNTRVSIPLYSTNQGKWGTPICLRHTSLRHPEEVTLVFYFHNANSIHKNSIVWVLKRTIHDRATATCRRSDCQLLRIEGATWSAWRTLRPYTRFSRQEPLLFYQAADQLYSRGWVDPVPDPLLFFWQCRESNPSFPICTQKLWPLDHRGGQQYSYASGKLKHTQTRLRPNVVCTIYEICCLSFPYHPLWTGIAQWIELHATSRMVGVRLPAKTRVTLFSAAFLLTQQPSQASMQWLPITHLQG